jgi:parallel beta-helix repeat protein
VNKIVVFGVLFLFIASSVVPISGLRNKQSIIQPINSKTLYVGGSGPNNYTKIQDAIDNASYCDTVFVYYDSSPYYEHIVIHTRIWLIGEDCNTTIIKYASWDGSIKVVVDGVHISGFTIKNGIRGIVINANNCVISHNHIIHNNLCSITLQNSDHNIIQNNNLSNNHKYGIELYNSWQNKVITNNFVDNNDENAYFRGDSTHDDDEFNRWKFNYWDDAKWWFFDLFILDYCIVGERLIGPIAYSVYEWDNYPAKEPYDIPDPDIPKNVWIMNWLNNFPLLQWLFELLIL